jgi:3-phosphoshikimate 1-carboxyvinyltransferase
MSIRPAASLRGTVNLPGDKSISHRAAMLGAIAVGETRISNYAASADCASTLSCLQGLGVRYSQQDGHITITGKGKYGLTPSAEPLDSGNSGTTMRLLSGILAGQAFETVVSGDDSLQSRPMERIAEPLRRMGAEIHTDNGRAPLKIKGVRPLSSINYSTPVASAQIKSCLLLAGLFADGTTVLTEAAQTRDHTERMLEWMKAPIRIPDSEGVRRISVDGDGELQAGEIDVPGDISAAAFFMVAAACLPGSDLVIPNVGVNPTRIAILHVLKDLGAQIDVTGHRELCNEPRADLHVRGGLDPDHQGVNVIRGATIANLIDEIPILAVLGTQLEGGLEVRDAAELRVKETDRIAAVCTNLRRMGADVTEYDDGFAIGRSKLLGVRVESFGDHRIAMAFAVAGMLAEGDTEIAGSECAAVSFPGFFNALDTVTN